MNGYAMRRTWRGTTGRSPGLSRREFLEAVGGAGLGSIVLATGSLALARCSQAAAAGAGGPLREIQLVAREVQWELAPGKVVKAWTYNGQVPGPEIRLKEGERVRILFKNELPEPTTIHWHGVDVPNPMDGVPGVTQEPVRPGGTFVYEFTATPPGTRWYHTISASTTNLTWVCTHRSS